MKRIKGSKDHPGADMQNVFVVSKSANGSRGNRIFGVGDTEPSNKKGGFVYEMGKGLKTRFCPHYNVGAIARSTLYTLVTYKDSFLQKYFSEETLNWLIEKASTEEVSLWEKHRNQALFELQGNRNVFVDYPHYATKIDFSNCLRSEDD